MYRYVERYNFADTCFDADEIEYRNEKYFNTFEQAVKYAQEEHKSPFRPTESIKFEFDEDEGEWVHCCMGSYAPVLHIKECVAESEE